MRKVLRSALHFVPFTVRDRIKHIPGLAAAQRILISRTLDGNEFTHRVDAGPAKGVTFRIGMPEDKGIWTGTYELAFATRLAHDVNPGGIAYDIGSWHGFFAGVMAANGAREVHVFEPLPANAERIRSLVSLNPDKLITLHACAVGERNTEMDLLVSPETSMAKLETSTFQSQEAPGTRIKVPVRTIDSMVAGGIAAPSLMKIDVEGAETMVLSGALSTLRTARPVVFAEVHSSALLAECTSILTCEGYAVERIDADPAEARARDVFHIRAVHRGGS
jgi:FkbM family methyltransferase